MENFEINVTPNDGELVIRKGDALPLKEEVPVKVVGNIDSVYRWLEKRKGLIDEKRSHILVNRDKLSIVLKSNERDHYADNISGQLTFHPIFLKFGINSGKYRSAFEMAELIKMNRSYFETHQVAMTLVTELKNIRAKVDKEIEKADNNRGDRRLLIDQTVKTNVPERFTLIIPIFKGQPKQTIEVEVYFNPDDLSCTLVSPQANDTIQSVTDSIIDEQLTLIKGECPDIVQIEL